MRPTKTFNNEDTPEVRLNHLLRRVWKEEVKVKSNYAREHAEIVAMAASMQLITTKLGGNLYGGAWNITNRGLAYINEKDD